MRKIVFIFIVLLFAVRSNAQIPDTVFGKITVPTKYADQLSRKIEKYNQRLTTKTEKTLNRLSRWEGRIRSILHKVSPETEQKLFGNEKSTFNSLLTRFKSGEKIVHTYQSQYDSYRDQLNTGLHYLQEQETAIDQKLTKSIANARKESGLLEERINTTEYIKAFIKKRKSQLINEAATHLISSRYLSRINKESYYYVETLRNYKEIFSSPGKTEALVKRSLNEIPAFREFMKKNSMLASLFSIPGTDGGGGTSNINLAGLQTRASVQSMIQQRIAAGGPNAANQLRQNLSDAQSKLTELKDKLLKGGVLGSGGEIEMPSFKPNQQRSKTLWQRMEYGFDVQFAKNNSYLPSTTELGLNAGYKLNDKSVIGVGMSYKLGMGSIDHIHFSSEGLGLRSFLDWKIKGSMYASGGYEMNYLNCFKRFGDLKKYDDWQRSALVGVSKRYKVSRMMKGEVQVLYDFMAGRHVPVSSPFIFRVGYKL